MNEPVQLLLEIPRGGLTNFIMIRHCSREILWLYSHVNSHLLTRSVRHISPQSDNGKEFKNTENISVVARMSRSEWQLTYDQGSVEG